MSLRFIYGKAGSGKTYFCMNEINKIVSSQNDKRIILIVPEQYSYMAQKNIFSFLKEDKSNKVIIWDFKKMNRDILKKLGVSRNYLDGSGRNMLIYEILKRKKSEFKTFFMAAQKKGFVSVISSLISEFKRFNVSQGDILAAINNLEEGDLKNKLEDIYIIYSELEKEIKDRYIDIEDNLSFLLKQESAFDIFKNSLVYIDEFKSFTPVQYEILRNIFKLSKEVNITLNYEDENKDNIIFNDLKNTEDRILNIIGENNIPLEEPVILKESRRFIQGLELKFLEKEFFSYPNKIYKGNNDNIKLGRSMNRYKEAVNAAEEIIHLTRDKGLRYKEIAVVTRDLSLYENLINSVFKEYDIPNFIDEKKEITGNIIIVLFNSLLKIYKNNWDYEGVFTLFKTGFFNISEEEISLLENYIIASGIRGEKKWNLDFLYKASGFEEKLPYINEIRKKAVSPITKILNKVHGRQCVKDFAKYLYEFMEELNIYEKIVRLIEDYNKEGFISYGLMYKQIYNIVIGNLDEIVQVMGETEATFEDFMNIFLSGLEEKKVGIIPASIDEVMVTSCDRLRSADIKAMFLIGVNDGVFPRGGYLDGILKDDERETLGKMQITLAKNTFGQVYDEQYLIYKTLTSCSKYLYLSYAVSDEEGKALRPSYIITRLKKLFPGLKEENDLLDTGEEIKISAKLPTFNNILLNIKNGRKEEIDQIFSYFLKDEKYKVRIERMIDTLSFNDTDDIQAIAQKLYGKLNISASRLETYVKCPFSYFAKYGLRLQERQEFNLSSLDIGSFLHYILEEFSKYLNKNKINESSITRDNIESIVRKLVESYIDNSKGNIFESSSKYMYFKERLITLSVQTIEIINKGFKSSSFKPKYFEKEFNDKSDFPPLIIKLKGGEEVNIVGKIDRIDVFEEDGKTYLRIIDYKSGTKDFSLSDMYYGTSIQLLLYLQVAQRSENGIPAGMFYFKLDDPIVKAKNDLPDEKIEEEIEKSFRMKGIAANDLDIIRKMDNDINGSSLTLPVSLNADGSLSKTSSVLNYDDFNNLEIYLEKIINENAEKMLSGEIKAYPASSGLIKACDYCRYSSVCGFDPSISGKSYNYLKKQSDDEVLIKISEEINNGGK